MARFGTIDHEYKRRAYHLRRLGFSGEGDSAYESYLASGLWRQAHERYANSMRPDYCFVCGGRPTELHHITYQRLGFERPEDLVRLCRRHHKSTSTLVDVHRYGFAQAHAIERRAVWERRWRRLAPEVRQRVADARGTRLHFAGDVISVRANLPEVRLEPVVVTVKTTDSEITIYLTFPDGLAEDRFQLNTKPPL